MVWVWAEGEQRPHEKVWLLGTLRKLTSVRARAVSKRRTWLPLVKDAFVPELEGRCEPMSISAEERWGAAIWLAVGFGTIMRRQV